MSEAEDDPSRRAPGDGDDESDRDGDEDARAILARRRAFVVSALAGLAIGASSADCSRPPNGGTVESPPHPCLMVQPVDPPPSRADAATAGPTPVASDAESTATTPMPCLMVIAPSNTGDGDTAAPRPCLEYAPPDPPEARDGGRPVPQPCLRMVNPATRADAGSTRRPPTTPAPCLSPPVRREPQPVACLMVAPMNPKPGGDLADELPSAHTPDTDRGGDVG